MKTIFTLFLGGILIFSLLATATPQVSAQSTALTFATVGDYGVNNQYEAAVAAMVAGWNPDLILGLGDGYYAEAGGTLPEKYDLSTGRYYCAFLKDITTTGTFCPVGQASVNRFFPALGDHDYDDAGTTDHLPTTYTNYFNLPGTGYTSSSNNERYYDFVAGPVHFFVLNSMDEAGTEPDGADRNSVQAQWLRTQLGASTSVWNVVVAPSPPYSSGTKHGSLTQMQWPFAQWGADVVLSGDEHNYERITRDGIVYFVNGLGGQSIYPFGTPLEGSALRYNANHGAQRITATDTFITFEFYSTENGGTLQDTYTITTPHNTATPTFTTTPSSTPTAVLALNSTGWLNPGSQAKATSNAGDNNGYEVNATAAYLDDSIAAMDMDSGTSSSTACTDSGVDKHRFYNYGISLPAGAVVQGIQVRLDSSVDSTVGNPKSCVSLSSDAGITWSSWKATPILSNTETTYLLGGSSDNWGRAWTNADVSSSNFQVRIADITGDNTRDFSLDWVAVNLTYGLTPSSTPTETATWTPTATATITPSPTETNTVTSTASTTPTDPPTATLTSSPTETATLTATLTSSPTEMATLTASPTETNTATATASSIPTATQTDAPTATLTSSSTAIPTLTAIPTETNTATSSSTPTATQTDTSTATVTKTPTQTATHTPAATQTATVANSATPTKTATRTPTWTSTAQPGSLSQIKVSIGGANKGNYLLGKSQNQEVSYAGVDNGPVQIVSNNGQIVASERVAYSPDGGTTWTSYSELMGMPVNQLTTSYTFPWYNNADLNTQLRFGNVGTSSTTVTVTIGGQVRGSYQLLPNQSTRASYPGLNAGPVKVTSSGNVPIITSERVAYFNGSDWTSFSEIMGLPSSKLTTGYLFPWYNNVDINSQLRFGNVGAANTTVTVTIGGVNRGTYDLAPNQSTRVSYSDLNNGPVKVTSSGGVPIIASMRVAYTPDNGATWPEFSEMMGMPLPSLSTSYSFPLYNNLDLNTQLRFGNIGNASTTVTVTIGGVVRGTYTLAPNASQRVSYPINSGPVVIQSSGNIPIIASLRVAYFDPSINKWTSFAEMMGLPREQLTASYLFPWYNNVNLNTPLRFGVP